MNLLIQFLYSLYAVFLCLIIFSSALAEQTDPLELQQQAISRYDAVIKHLRKTGDFQSIIPDLVQAEAELAASNRMLSASGNWSALALGLIKQGHTFRMQGKWTNAITCYQQAEEAAKRGRDAVRQADALAWKGSSESSRRNVGQALADAAQAVRLAEAANDKEVLARALNILCAVQIAQRDLSAASDTNNREIAAASQVKEPMALYNAYMNRSDIYLTSGEKCDFQRSTATCYQALDHACANMQQALAIVKKLDYDELVRQTMGFIANIETRRELIKRQEAMYQSTRKTKVFHPREPSDVLVTEKFVAPPGDIPEVLIQKYEEIKKLEKRAGGFADSVKAGSEFIEGMMNETQGNYDVALSFFNKAVDTLDLDRRMLRDERSRGTFMEDRISYYYEPILLLLERRRYAEAFKLLERSRSRALADLLASRKLGIERPKEQKLYAESTLLRSQIADAQSKLFELVSQTEEAENSAKISTLQNRIRNLEVQYQESISRMTAEAPRLKNLVVPKPVSLDELQQSMRKESYEMLQYLVLEHGLILWHIKPDSVRVYNVFLPRIEVIAKVAALKDSLSNRNGSFDETVARELFLFLVQPVLSGIRSERLVIIPHEDLHYVPFQALQDPTNGRYLGEQFQITYAPSSTVLLGLKKSSGLSSGKILAIADPGIVAARPEVQAISKLFPGRSKVVFDHLAKEKDVKAWVSNFDVVHLAVHGKFDAGEPMLSYLKLAPDDSDDGRLTAAEMFGLALDRSRLVVLSGCETGRAEATHGNEILGMVRALMFAGAGTMVVSSWKVDSEATTLWMQTFYEAARTRSIPEASRAALVKVKSNSAFSHPYYWAAFSITGR